jgi:hypothetical protein
MKDHQFLVRAFNSKDSTIHSHVTYSALSASSAVKIRAAVAKTVMKNNER